MQRLAAAAALLFLLMLALPAFAAAPVVQRTGSPVRSGGLQPQQLSVEERLQLLERRIQALTDLLLRMDGLQQEIQQLRGDVELQSHTLEGLKKRQRDLYLDIDRRLTQLSPQPAPAPGMAPAAVGPGSASTMGPTGLPGEKVSDRPPLTAPPGAAKPQAQAGVPVTEAPAKPPVGATSGQPVTPMAAASSPAVDTAPEVAADPAMEQPMYKKAFDLLMQRRYDEAKQGFREFLVQYPKGRLAANAQYWVGEASYVTRDFTTALAEFSKVVQNYPSSSKVSDALLKMGYIRYEQQQWAQARKTLEAVVDQHPTSTASRLARKRLERMRIEGN